MNSCSAYVWKVVKYGPEGESGQCANGGPVSISLPVIILIGKGTELAEAVPLDDRTGTPLCAAAS